MINYRRDGKYTWFTLFKEDEIFSLFEANKKDSSDIIITRLVSYEHIKTYKKLIYDYLKDCYKEENRTTYKDHYLWFKENTLIQFNSNNSDKHITILAYHEPYDGWTYTTNNNENQYFHFIWSPDLVNTILEIGYNNKFFYHSDEVWFNDKSIIIRNYYINSRWWYDWWVIDYLCNQSQFIKELYPDFDLDKLLDEYTHSDESLLILLWKPWTWKTTIIRSLLEYLYLKWSHENDLVIYVKDEKVLYEEEFYINIQEVLPEKRKVYLILDDFDKGLESRDRKVVSYVNKLLSLSNWVFSNDKNNLKIIITSNIDVDELDSALTRPWRCFDILRVNELTYNQAKDIWINVLNQDETFFNKKFEGVEFISQASLVSYYKELKRTNNKWRSYLKNPEISLRKN